MIGIRPRDRAIPEIKTPKAVASYILYLKQIYPPIHDREIVRIIGRKFGYETNHHTVKSFLERHPIPVQLELDFTYFHDFEDAYQARWTVVRMHFEGWNKKVLPVVSNYHAVMWVVSSMPSSGMVLPVWRTSAPALQTTRVTN